MHLRLFLVSTVLFLLPVVHAASISEVNEANLALQEEADKYDSNVQKLGILNPALINGNGIANDLANFTTAVATSLHNSQGTAATNDTGTEQSVVDSFAVFSDALAGYMEDLRPKSRSLFLQRDKIHDTLGQLLPNYNTYAAFIRGLVDGDVYKGEIDNAISDAARQIAVTRKYFG